MSDELKPHKPDKVLSKTQAQKLIAKLQMKYGAELQNIQDELKNDVDIYGYVRPETEVRRQSLIEKIKDEEKSYR